MNAKKVKAIRKALSRAGTDYRIAEYDRPLGASMFQRPLTVRLKWGCPKAQYKALKKIN